jgi:predicted lipid-binding transport protein (Tim44 family)
MLALLVVAGLAGWRMLRGSRNAPYRYQPQPAPAYGGSDLDDQPLPRMASVGARPGSVADVLSGSSASASSAPAAPWGVPADFDVPAFIRSAKVHFIRLQAAWDARNLADIREFTTPEVYAEIKMQLDEEKGANHRTEVVGLEAQLLGIEEGATDYLASVRFSGAMREDDSSSAEPFQEVWNLAKPKDGRSGWLLSGIQQLH